MTDTPNSEQDRRVAEVVSKHLPPGYSAEPDVLVDDHATSSSSSQDITGQESSLKLKGGDVHRDLFKINARAKQPQRSATFAGFSSHPQQQRSYGGTTLTTPPSGNEPFTASEQQGPGMFRRQYLLNSRRLSHVATLPTQNFAEFLDLYGGFAGEDLYDSDDESAIQDEDEESQSQAAGSERRPLLGRRKSSKATKKGDAGELRSFFTLIKAFVGTGIMFLPKAFNNGGMLFSSMTMIIVSLLTCVCFHLLLECRKRYGGGGYGDLGKDIVGPKMRSLILSSIAISQIGFVCAGIIFTAENMFSFLDAVTPKDTTPLSTPVLIGVQLILLAPLALIRNISKLGPFALLADICIVIGLTYIYQYDISFLSDRGMHPTVALFNPELFTLTIGSAIFTFEGIGLILPIQSSMKNPEKFSTLLYLVMFIITIIFTSVGVLCYATFGDETKTEIISNFPQTDKLVNAVQFLYSLAVLVGTPVQLFPALRILEGRLFGHRSGKKDAATKWKKNFFRMSIVVLCGAISVAGASDLDKFVALIGSFACIPLVYIYPAFLHYKGVTENRWVKAGDVLLMIVGLGAMIYTTSITLSRWAA